MTPPMGKTARMERVLTAQPLSAEALAPYGTVISPGQVAPVPGGSMRVGGFGAASLSFDALAQSGVTTMASAGTWYLAVAVDPEHFTAFVVPPATTVVLHEHTWYAGPFSETPSTVVFVVRAAPDTAVHPLSGTYSIEAERSRRVLVVANRTANSPELKAALARLAGAGATEFRVVVPVGGQGGGLPALAAAWDPLAGVPPVAILDPPNAEAARAEAQERLDDLLSELRGLGATVTGAVGPSDPMLAIVEALAEGPAHEILLSTLPAGISKWLSRDLPSRCAKRFGIPVTHVEGSAPKT